MSTQFAFKVKVADLKAAWLFAPQKDIRAYLNSVCIDDGKLIATDGNRLIVIEAEPNALQSGEWPKDRKCLIPQSVIEAIVKGRTFKGKNLTLLITEGNEQLTRLIVDDGTVTTNYTFKTNQEAFPDYNRVIPKLSDELTMPAVNRFNLTFLTDAIVAANLVNPPEKGDLALGMLRLNQAVPSKADTVAQWHDGKAGTRMVYTRLSPEARALAIAEFEALPYDVKLVHSVRATNTPALFTASRLQIVIMPVRV
jgi:hypothetical protein